MREELRNDSPKWELGELTRKSTYSWTSKESDRDYSIMVKRQPFYLMDGDPFKNGKPYKIFLHYWLKGYQLFIATLRVDDLDDPEKDFESKELIDLSECSPMTEIIMSKKQHWLLSTYDKAFCWGERFFFKHKKTNEKPYEAAFAIQFPEDSNFYGSKKAFDLSTSIKYRIFEASNAQGHHHPPLTTPR